ncbi:MAG: hypothetical protein B6I20_02215 [Bacteroidetes bacterium 4572_117]|nr:MAG: hypothetical protein B6I20_02215 [Bacteroidetes bacterium 4572_117]
MEVINKEGRQGILDEEHLNLLSIFYFIFGGLSIFSSFIILVYLTLFSAIFTKLPIKNNDIEDFPFEILFSVFVALFLFVFVYGILLIVAGVNIRKKTKRVFSLVIGAMAMLSFPLGTALGVFSIIVFTRSSVVELYRLEAEREKLSLFKG